MDGIFHSHCFTPFASGSRRNRHQPHQPLRTGMSRANFLIPKLRKSPFADPLTDASEILEDPSREALWPRPALTTPAVVSIYGCGTPLPSDCPHRELSSPYGERTESSGECSVSRYTSQNCSRTEPAMMCRLHANENTAQVGFPDQVRLAGESALPMRSWERLQYGLSTLQFVLLREMQEKRG